MEALTKIEIEFARLRDRLYLERMADVERERIGVETGMSFYSFLPSLESLLISNSNLLFIVL